MIAALTSAGEDFALRVHLESGTRRRRMSEVVMAVCLCFMHVCPGVEAQVRETAQPTPPVTNEAQVDSPVQQLPQGLTRANANKIRIEEKSLVAPITANSSEAKRDESAAESRDRYRIGAGDLIDVRVLNRVQYSREGIRVTDRGTIQMPLIEGEIQAACRTESELGQEIAARYRRYQRNPQIDVFIREFNSKPVSVIGAVNAPGRFQLQRRIHLLELLTFVNGPSDRAGRTIQIVRLDSPLACAETTKAPPAVDTMHAGISNATDDTNQGEDAASEDVIISLPLRDVLRSAPNANPSLQPGDIVTVLEADQIYVVGNVLNPTALPLKSEVTISQAIAMAGGVIPDTKTSKVRIVRQTNGGGKQEIYVDLKAIDKQQAEDIALQANDIVDVPSSMTTKKRIVRGILSSFAPSLGQLPVRVIR